MPKRKKTAAKNRWTQIQNEYDNDDNNDGDENSDDENLIPTNSEEEFNNQRAAKESRLKHSHLTSLEQKLFHNVDRAMYLNFRNTILRFWLNNPSIGLTTSIVKSKMKISDKKKLGLIEKIIKFLERYGYINYGIFENNLPEKCVNPGNRKRKIIIIGAGASGLIAARQLIYFGFDVIILEASKRVGGRCYAYYKNEIFFDAGNVLVSGVRGNPIRTVMKQLGLNAKQLKSKHKLYMDGHLVDKKKDLVMQKIFLLFLRTLYFITIEKGITEMNGHQLSPENIFDVFIYFLEVVATGRALEFSEKLLHLEENISINLNPFTVEFDFFLKNIKFFRLFYRYSGRLVQPGSSSENQNKADFDRTINFDENLLSQNLSHHSILKSHLAFLKCIRFDEIHKDISVKKIQVTRSDKFKGCSEFFSLEDRRIFEWYFGTLEYFLGAPLSEYSLKRFADDNFDHTDKQYVIPDGYMYFMQAMYSQGCSMKILKRTQAKKITIKENGIEVVALKDNTEQLLFRGDAIICTVPLGVLKKAVDDKDQTFKNKIIFEPPLPVRKRSAIERFGFGTINKVIMGFDSNFWGSKDQYLGNVALSRECRGEFLFTYFQTPPIKEEQLSKPKDKKKKKPKQMHSVSSVLCGKCIDTMTITDDVIVISKAYNGLKEIFENIPPFAAGSVTHWEREPFYMGTHSYPTTKSCTDDYDILAEPVSLPNYPPRLFFAGEHTNKDYPATVHGAFLSGLRAATEIANCFDPLDLKST